MVQTVSRSATSSPPLPAYEDFVAYLRTMWQCSYELHLRHIACRGGTLQDAVMGCTWENEQTISLMVSI